MCIEIKNSQKCEKRTTGIIDRDTKSSNKLETEKWYASAINVTKHMIKQ